MRQMYERAYGNKYEQAKGKSTAEIAALIRADVKAAIREGYLPGAARNYSIRSDNFSGGRAIRVSAKGLDGMWRTCPGDDSCASTWCRGNPHQTLTPQGAQVQAILTEIHAAYNHDGSDSMVDYFDVSYYGQVSIER